ncbi:hypothetical protein [Rothia sp. CCM 9416]|uniref:hypothetical protein n=1 Tax=Rothia sp. CCM 9416 TaxID=3402655 RepID=UPI003AE17122
MSQKNNKGESAESGETPQKINYPVLSLVLLMWALILGTPLYYGWRLFIYDRSHQVPLVCTVESAEHKSSTSSGVRYSSSRDDIVFSTEDCGGLYMPVSESEIESTLSRVEPGKKYEFMIGETSLKSWGQRKVFSFSGPVE